MMNIMQVLRASVLAGSVMLTATAASAHPTFSPESISDFSAALATLKTAQLNMAKVWTLDGRHADSSRFHAYRFLDPDVVFIGIAKSISLNAAGHLEIVPESHAPLSGRPNKTHQEYSHILVPVSVTPPT
jgi:hypothetical protein